MCRYNLPGKHVPIYAHTYVYIFPDNMKKMRFWNKLKENIRAGLWNACNVLKLISMSLNRLFLIKSNAMCEFKTQFSTGFYPE